MNKAEQVFAKLAFRGKLLTVKVAPKLRVGPKIVKKIKIEDFDPPARLLPVDDYIK